ncbi:MAG: carbonic anhydrase [Ktedonobacteraceae bacterium]|nr:carbonic anhydrase [Ktedonobacteraceae bacterium]
MTTLDTLEKRNHDFAEHEFVADLPIMPGLKTMIISCVDPRVDPTHVLGLELGEAVVIRNIGGRITPATLQAMGMLRMISQIAGANPEGRFDLIVLHHTDCGITRLEGKPDLLASYFGIDKAELESKAVTDPRAAVAADIAMIKAKAPLPDEWAVSGLVYDVKTGLVETVVTPDLRQ